ncbi:MAG: molybdopterin cofactor-binding domain-containing protein [Chitinophagales bacterium]
MERRNFIKLSVVYSSGFLVLHHFPVYSIKAENDVPFCFQPHPLLKLCDDGSIVIYVRKQEFGQGVDTSLPMIVAEELDAQWKDVRSEIAPFEYEHKDDYVTWASCSVKDNWQPLREAGALAREMLIQAAANKWNIDTTLCITEKSKVINSVSQASIAYKDLILAASDLPIPETPKLKNYQDFKLIGKHKKKINTANLVMGKTLFSYDFSLPNMMYALVLRCPVYGGTIIKYDASEAANLKGVYDIVEIQPMPKAKVQQGIAVVADSFWTAQKAITLIDVEWDFGKFEKVSSASFMQNLKDNIRNKELVVLDEFGKAETAYKKSKIKTELQFEYPFLAQAPIEPPSCTATYKDGKFEIWGGYQNPGLASDRLCESFNIERENLQINLMLIGGGFGRRVSFDNAAEAMQLAKVTEKPIKLYWSRMDDMKHSAYRPAVATTILASLNRHKNLKSWEFKSSGSAFMVDTWATEGVPDWAIKVEGSGGARGEFYYPVNNFKSGYFHEPAPVNTGPWRSISNSVNNFSIECTIDDLANKANMDPLAFRLHLLAENTWTKLQSKLAEKEYTYQPKRMVNLLKRVAKHIGWNSPKKKDHYYGIACCPYVGAHSYAAHAFDISVSVDKKIKIHRVVAGIDCGIVINPDGVYAQMEGAFIWALSAVLRGEITLSNGIVQQATFKQYDVLRYDEMPPLEIIIINSEETPGSVGEVGVPSVASALCNAIFSATGDRITKLPIRNNGYELIK